MEVLKFLEGSGDIGLVILALWLFMKSLGAKLDAVTLSLKECTKSINDCTTTLTEHAVKLENGNSRMDRMESEIINLRSKYHDVSSVVQRHEAKLKD